MNFLLLSYSTKPTLRDEQQPPLFIRLKPSTYRSETSRTLNTVNCVIDVFSSITRNPILNPTMDVDDRELRMAAWNVIIVDHFRVPFAGFYQNPRKPRILFRDALEHLLRSTTLTMDNCTGPPQESPAALAWGLWPLGGTCSEGVTVESLEESHGNMMKPISPGRYYLVRHCNICCNIKELLNDPMETLSCGHVKSELSPLLISQNMVQNPRASRCIKCDIHKIVS